MPDRYLRRTDSGPGRLLARRLGLWPARPASSASGGNGRTARVCGQRPLGAR
ncbi:hypothetical protein [Streptomyces sp. NPDC053427]|uniref:hypothetical protein n=1 Tax=Streptomyces sp. NPDC053427 TaxID=3365701 RepID=UPI0037D3B36A